LWAHKFNELTQPVCQLSRESRLSENSRGFAYD
jgi:hypothetical protein